MLAKFHTKFFLIALLALSCEGCAHVEDHDAASAYDAATQARIRVFHGPAIYIYSGDVCEPGPHSAIHAGAGGFSYFVPNKTIGMPRTSGMHSFSYNEYVLPAGEMATIKMYWQQPLANGTWDTCGPWHLLFTPQAGADYETYLQFEGNACTGIALEKVKRDSEGNTIREPAILNAFPFVRC